MMAAIARVSSDSANLMCCRPGLLISSSLQLLPDIAVSSDGILMQTVTLQNGSTLPLHLPPSATGALVLPTACLSQHVWKLAGEEGLACANYILIIGNVLANQALIAILELSAG